jgi:hypothetical protein
MKKIAGWKSALFLGGLGLIAIALFIRESNRKHVHQTVVYSSIPQPVVVAPPIRPQTPVSTNIELPKSKTNELIVSVIPSEPSKPVIDEHAVAHKAFLAQNVNPGFTRGNVPLIAVVSVVDGKLNPRIASKLVERLTTNGFRLVSSFFTPEFVSSGNFKALFQGTDSLISRLELTNALDGLVLAEEETKFETTPSLQNLVTASIQLEVSIIHFSDFNNRHIFFRSMSGPGFRESEALSAAEERVVRDLSHDTNFSLTRIFSAP